MQQQSFKVEFFCDEHFEEQQIHEQLYKYTAQVTLISKNFKVFKVSAIRRIENGNVIALARNYVVTSYPSSGSCEETKWKDALTFRSGKFVELVGGAIEECIEKAASSYQYN